MTWQSALGQTAIAVALLTVQWPRTPSTTAETQFSFGTRSHPCMQGAGNRHARVALMSHTLHSSAAMDQCTQTPFPGSELLDPDPFVRSPIKPKDSPSVGDKRSLPSESVSDS